MVILTNIHIQYLVLIKKIIQMNHIIMIEIKMYSLIVIIIFIKQHQH